MKKITISVIIFIIFCASAYPVIYMNYFCNTLIPDECTEPNGLNNKETLAYLQAQTANNFLQANANWNLFLAKIEMVEVSPVDYGELNNILENTVLKIDEAIEIFAIISDTSQQYQVNPIVMENLKNFDYTCFGDKHNLNQDVMSEVECYLSIGDILGIPNRFRDKLVEIKIQIEVLKKSVERQATDIDEMYSVNQSFLTMALFGQYTAMILREVRIE